MAIPLYTPLTDRQELFVSEYLIDLNASAAARRAGFSPRTHGARAAALMKNPAVRERINIGLRALRERLGATALNVMRDLARVAFFDARNAIDRHGKVIPLHDMDDDTAAALIFSSRTLKGGETVMSLRQPSRMSALLALDRRFAREEELERLAYAEEDARRAAEDEKTARERRYKPEHTLIKEAEARQAQQRELDTLAEERDALAEQVRPVKLPDMPAKAPPRKANGTQAASMQPAPLQPASLQPAPATATPAKAAPGKVAPSDVAPAKAAMATPVMKPARQAIEALFEPLPVARVPDTPPGAPDLPALELLTDVRPAPGQPAAPAAAPDLPPALPGASKAWAAASAGAAGVNQAAALAASEAGAACGSGASADMAGAVAGAGGELVEGASGGAVDGALDKAKDDADRGPDGGGGVGTDGELGGELDCGEEGEDNGYDEYDVDVDAFFVPVPVPEPAPAPAPIKRRNINLWGESTDFPRKPPPDKEPVVPGSNWPEGFVLKAGSRVPAPWETFAGGPKPPGIVKDPRPQFAVGAGEFQWSDEYLEDGDT